MYEKNYFSNNIKVDLYEMSNGDKSLVLACCITVTDF